MSIYNISGQPVQVYISPKEWPDLKQDLQVGQFLKGRVAEVFPNNRAMINIRGFNVMAETTSLILHKGDILNVQVAALGDKTLLRIFPPQTIASEIATESTSIIDLSQLLTEMKIPVNEQNMTIASKLLDYQLPLTRENILEVSQDLKLFLEGRPLTGPASSGPMDTRQINERLEQLKQNLEIWMQNDQSDGSA